MSDTQITMTPKEIVSELDRFIIDQKEANKQIVQNRRQSSFVCRNDRSKNAGPYDCQVYEWVHLFQKSIPFCPQLSICYYTCPSPNQNYDQRHRPKIDRVHRG